MQGMMPSERQLAEWGVRSFKGPFGRLGLPLSANSRKRKRLLTVCAHLISMRTRLVGLNQIQTVYGEQSAITAGIS